MGADEEVLRWCSRTRSSLPLNRPWIRLAELALQVSIPTRVKEGEVTRVSRRPRPNVPRSRITEKLKKEQAELKALAAKGESI